MRGNRIIEASDSGTCGGWNGIWGGWNGRRKGGRKEGRGGYSLEICLFLSSSSPSLSSPSAPTPFLPSLPSLFYLFIFPLFPFLNSCSPNGRAPDPPLALPPSLPPFFPSYLPPFLPPSFRCRHHASQHLPPFRPRPLSKSGPAPARPRQRSEQVLCHRLSHSLDRLLRDQSGGGLRLCLPFLRPRLCHRPGGAFGLLESNRGRCL